MFTRKHFEFLAKALGEVLRNDQRSTTLPEAFANKLVGTNPQFDKERFLAAVFREIDK